MSVLRTNGPLVVIGTSIIGSPIWIYFVTNLSCDMTLRLSSVFGNQMKQFNKKNNMKMNRSCDSIAACESSITLVY